MYSLRNNAELPSFSTVQGEGATAAPPTLKRVAWSRDGPPPCQIRLRSGTFVHAGAWSVTEPLFAERSERVSRHDRGKSSPVHDVIKLHISRPRKGETAQSHRAPPAAPAFSLSRASTRSSLPRTNPGVPHRSRRARGDLGPAPAAELRALRDGHAALWAGKAMGTRRHPRKD